MKEKGWTMQEKRQTAMKTGFDFAFACDKNVHF
jgi:hypothetical protein